jgi:hypothetical protein
MAADTAKEGTGKNAAVHAAPIGAMLALSSTTSPVKSTSCQVT